MRSSFKLPHATRISQLCPFLCDRFHRLVPLVRLYRGFASISPVWLRICLLIICVIPVCLLVIAVCLPMCLYLCLMSTPVWPPCQPPIFSLFLHHPTQTHLPSAFRSINSNGYLIHHSNGHQLSYTETGNLFFCFPPPKEREHHQKQRSLPRNHQAERIQSIGGQLGDCVLQWDAHCDRRPHHSAAHRCTGRHSKWTSEKSEFFILPFSHCFLSVINFGSVS